MPTRRAAFIAAAALAASPRLAFAQGTEGDPGAWLPFNGFKVDRTLVPLERIVRGGPPRDGIPAIDRPRFVPASASTLAPLDRVLGVVHRGIARAYPVRILNWHEVVNDHIGGDDIAVTYCPLCGSGVVFDAAVGARRLSFGVSGLLFDSDMLMYDRQTESLWSQLKFQAVTGPLIGERLTRIGAEHTTWRDWRSRWPRTMVLSFETGFERDYARDPYTGYDREPGTLFPVGVADARLDPKVWVVGVQHNGAAKAWPIEALGPAAGVLDDAVGDLRVRVRFDARHRTARVEDAQGRTVPSITAFWFAWAAFNPRTELYDPVAARRPTRP